MKFRAKYVSRFIVDIPQMSVDLSTLPLSLVHDESLFDHIRKTPVKNTLFFYLFGTSEYAGHRLFESEGHEVICQMTWGRGGIAFRCMDCEKDVNCVVCAECFFDSEDKHADHRVKLVRTSGGCCDCGDVSSWNRDGFCSKHGHSSSVSEDVILEAADLAKLTENSKRLMPLVVELISRSITTDVNKRIASVGFEFLLECCRISKTVFRPIILSQLTPEILSTWIQVSCVFSGRNPRPRPPVTSVPPREDCNEIAASITDFALSMVQLSAEFKIAFSRVYLMHYSEVIKFKGDLDESTRGDLGSLSVQLFTIPDVCEALLSPSENSGGLISVMLEQLHALLATLTDSQSGKISVREIRPDIDVMMWRVMHDFGYCLHHDVVCQYLLGSRSLLELLVKCVSPLQHANVQTIKHGDHVLYENVMWRTTFRLEQLFLTTLQPLFEFARKSEADISLLVMVVVGCLEPFDLLRFSGENGSFHTPLTRILARSVDPKNIIAQVPEWLPHVMSKSVLRHVLLEAIRPQLMVKEIESEAWIRNGDSLRYQAKEYAAQFDDTDATLMTIVLCLLGREMDPMAELIRAVLLLMADIPDDTTGDKTVLSDRHAFIANEARFGVDQMDDWWQLFLRDVILGGQGHSIDSKRRLAVFTFLLHALCKITTDSTYVDVAQLNLREPDISVRKRLVTRCLVQAMPGQRLSYSQILNLLPSALRQPEQLVDRVLERVATRERASLGAASGATYKLSNEGLKFFDVTHKVFPTADAHTVEEFMGADRNSSHLLGSREAQKDQVTEFIINALTGRTGFLLRLISSLLRVRLCDQFLLDCLGESEMTANQLDPFLLPVYKILDNLRACRSGIEAFRKGAESDPLWQRPRFGLPMELKGLIQRTDLNGLQGIYLGVQDGRWCISMAEHGKLLAKSSNADPTFPVNAEENYATSIMRLLDQLAELSKDESSDISAQAVRIIIERLAEATGTISARSSPNASVVMETDPGGSTAQRSALAKQRQALLMQRMKAQQAKFRAKTEEPLSPMSQESEETGHEDAHECAMCRDVASADDPIVAIGYCSSGNAVARISPPGTCVASPAAPYVNACLHTVHRSCWENHRASTESRGVGGLLTRSDSGEVQCPVCRTLANMAIPAVKQEDVLEASERIADEVLELGQLLLNFTKGAVLADPEASPMESGIESLWLSRSESGKPWRPVIFPPSVDSLVEATFNELLLSLALTPSKILSSFSLPVLLVRCTAIAVPKYSDWKVWEKSTREAEKIDCARLFLESGMYLNSDFAGRVLALRHLQLGAQGVDQSCYNEHIARLAVYMAWVVISVKKFSQAEINRIGYLPEDPSGRLAAAEQVLGVAEWRTHIPELERLLQFKSGIVAPHAVGGLIDFIPLPEKLTDLIRQVINKPCNRCKTCPPDPAVCLTCGAVICLDAECCKTEDGEGECTQHAKSCGAGQGVFILPYSSIVVAVGNPRNCIWEGPYQDSHGEPDSYLKRSCKLILSHHRLDQMRTFFTRGSIRIEIIRENQNTGRYVPRQL